MFREMQRIRQQLSQEECLRILREQPRGVLSVMGDGGYPYGMPLNHWYNEEDGLIWFHSGRTGHKIDALRREPRASFCVYDEGYREPGEWPLRIRSVIVFGQVQFLEDREKALDICRRLSYKFTRDEAYIEGELRRFGPGVLCFALKPEHISGKLVKES